ncbi:MAG: hypothetical protein V4487_02825 [Chlamydiota bacterium]
MMNGQLSAIPVLQGTGPKRAISPFAARNLAIPLTGAENLLPCRKEFFKEEYFFILYLAAGGGSCFFLDQSDL